LSDVLAKGSEGEIFKKYFGGDILGDWLDERTESITKLGEILYGATNKIKEVLGKLYDDIEKERQDYWEKLADIDTQGEQKLDDLNTQFARKQQDLATDLSRKLSDIELDRQNSIAKENTDYQQKIQDANQKASDAKKDADDAYRTKEIQAEKEFQEKLYQLRQQYLMDLDDAIAARDALQIVRLTRRYNAEKAQLIRENELRKQEDADDYAQKIKDIEVQKQRSLAELQTEHQQRLQEINLQAQKERQAAQTKYQQELDDLDLWKQRETDDLKLWRKRQEDDAEASYKKRVADAALALMEEYNWNEYICNAISARLRAMFGEQEQYINEVTELAKRKVAELKNTIVPPTTYHRTGITAGTEYAGGGSLFASQPTSVLFGERGPEVATFTPIGRTGVNVSQSYGSVPAGVSMSNSGGKVKMELYLSPDLEYRIIESALNGVADVVVATKGM
jgi:hypothetical protein